MERRSSNVPSCALMMAGVQQERPAREVVGARQAHANMPMSCKPDIKIPILTTTVSLARQRLAIQKCGASICGTWEAQSPKCYH
jgi:hypothetical protein